MNLKPFHHRALAILCLAAFLPTFLQAVEIRTWTDAKGRNLEARLVRVVDDKVELQLKDGKSATIKISTLSSADQKYLEDHWKVEMDVNDPSKPGEPEKDVRIDTKVFKSWDSQIALNDDNLVFDVLETPHFLILTNGSLRGKDTGQQAERMWHGMSFQHPTFRSKWEEEKKVIIMVEDSDVWHELGVYAQERLKEMDQNESADKLSKTWNLATSGGMYLEPGLVQQHKVFVGVRAIYAHNRSLQRGVWSPFRTHILADDMISQQIGGVAGFASEGLFAFTKGHSFFKEVSLTGTSVTQLLSAESYEGDEIFQRGGFEDARNWPKIVKQLLRKGAKPDMGELYQAKRETVTREEIVFMYGLSAFMQSTKGRLAAYANLVERMDTSAGVPEPIEVAKIFGYESAEAIHTDWHEWMGTSAFR